LIVIFYKKKGIYTKTRLVVCPYLF